MPDPTLTMTPEQHDFLATGATATLAVNDPSGAPQLTSSMYHWDGSTLRLPGKMFTARATNIDRDPRVSLLIEDAASGAWLAVTGVASMVHGDEAVDELTLLLSKYLEPDAVDGSPAGDALERGSDGHPGPSDAIGVATRLSRRARPGSRPIRRRCAGRSPCRRGGYPTVAVGRRPTGPW